MHGEDCRGAAALEVQVHRRERRRPVVAVHDLRTPFERRGAAAEERRRAREQPEAQRVIGPVRARFILVRPAGPVVQRRTVEQQELAGFQKAHLHFQELEASALSCFRGRNAAICGQQHAHVDALRAQRRRQRRADVAEPAGLGERRAFRRDKKDAHKKRPR
jgi:hypothetical protein